MFFKRIQLFKQSLAIALIACFLFSSCGFQEQGDSEPDETTVIDIFVNSAARHYGYENPAFSITVYDGKIETTGFTAGNDDQTVYDIPIFNGSLILESVKLETTALQHSPIGEYPIRIMDYVIPDTYDGQVVCHEGTLMVEPSPLYVIANPVTIFVNEFGQTQDPAVPTFSVSGLRLDETSDIIEGINLQVKEGFPMLTEVINGVITSQPIMEWCFDENGPVCEGSDGTICISGGWYQYNPYSKITRYTVMQYDPLSAPNYEVRFRCAYSQKIDYTGYSGVPPFTSWEDITDALYPHGFPLEGKSYIRAVAWDVMQILEEPTFDIDAWLSVKENIGKMLPFLAASLKEEVTDSNLQAPQQAVRNFIVKYVREIKTRFAEDYMDVFLCWKDVERWQIDSIFMSLFGPSDVPPDDLADRAAEISTQALGMTTDEAVVNLDNLASGISYVSAIVETGGLIGATAGLIITNMVISEAIAGVGFSQAIVLMAGASSAVGATILAAGVVTGVILAAVTAAVKIWQMVELDNMEQKIREAIESAQTLTLDDLDYEELAKMLTLRLATKPTLTPEQIQAYLNLL